ncbi:SipW-dependent-type signal peptide-containing protein [Olsenella sp. YH-ols2217]|uniref:SipW-dependent-type signal peptide-containing protein n=1 Tax=Kribbibacterium absianum TaxID=3044210 RepID=A0ABT6ZIK7_9ACTN|nr:MULTISPECIES: SipW-dependent-type signal peptide-containing protein [unclassified Olsenella]MDJ1121396.1 SipW-dependent-type signal peptide-containing protein [Olsenella sp. YH-ols2216]MDJ1128886.1 SipW-dependent-type signal peptide-containing protein [Olsenella sp. YH-ols2217]
MSKKMSARAKRVSRRLTRAFRGSAPAAAAVGLCLAGVLGAGSALAYLTDNDAVTNKFNVAADLKVQVDEPEWDKLPDTDKDGVPDVVEQMTPTQTVAKDPYVKNGSTTDAWCFARVGVPTKSVKHVIDNGTTKTSEIELFSYTLNPGWAEVGTGVKVNDVTWHTYRYDKEAVSAGAKTGSAIFSSVTLANVVEGQLSDAPLSIEIEGYGIQKQGFASCADAYAAYKLQNPSSNWA